MSPSLPRAFDSATFMPTVWSGGAWGIGKGLVFLKKFKITSRNPRNKGEFVLSTAALLPVPFRNLPVLSLSGHWGLLNFYLHLPTNSENNEENSPKKGQQRSRGILEQGATTQMMQREQAGCVCVCKEDSAQHGGGTQNRLWVPCVVLPSSVRKNIQRGTQNVCCLFVRLSLPGSLHLVPCNQGCAMRKG